MFDVRTPVSTGRLSADQASEHQSDADIRAIAARAWPDLGPEPHLAILPYADFELIVAATKGRQMLALHRIVDITLLKPPPETTHARRRRQLREWGLAVLCVLAPFGVAALVALVTAHG